jgi:hypothetical protein
MVVSLSDGLHNIGFIADIAANNPLPAALPLSIADVETGPDDFIIRLPDNKASR